MIPAARELGAATRPLALGSQLRPTRALGLIFEYACHEGNYGMEGMLAGARADIAREHEGEGRSDPLNTAKLTDYSPDVAVTARRQIGDAGDKIAGTARGMPEDIPGLWRSRAWTAQSLSKLDEAVSVPL